MNKLNQLQETNELTVKKWGRNIDSITYKKKLIMTKFHLLMGKLKADAIDE